MKMNSRIVALASAAFASFAFAVEMQLPPTVTSVKTIGSGVAKITCANPGDWKFDAVAGQDRGRDVVTVTLTSSKPAMPPQFGVMLRVPGNEVQNVWNCDFSRAAFKVDPRLWWGGPSTYVSELANNAPIAVAFNNQGRAPVALACSEAFNHVKFGLYADDRTCDMVARCELFTQSTVAIARYTVKVLLDRRNGPWYAAVRECAEWIAAENGFKPAKVPELARAPLYSTWYAYLQEVTAKPLEREAREAAALGMKTMILDDGWQKADSQAFYSACGDWQPAASRFPDMRAHVDAVHAAGIEKYMLWLAVPFMGQDTKHYAEFKDKLLRFNAEGRLGVLDPRFPEVREYLISTYERVIRDWDFDGVKLDFIDSFGLEGPDPALKDNYAGRDYRSIPEAVDRLMRDVLARLQAIKPDVLVEFRQHYMGPAIRQYGNMIRAADCPADMDSNRRRIADLRLTSASTAVHSDMLVWSRDATAPEAALPILSAIFGVIQYSMILADVNPTHKEVIRAWINFSQAHRDTLLRGDFRPHHPESGYPLIEAESAAERIVAAYNPDIVVPGGKADRPTLILNATMSDRLTVDLPAPARARRFDTLGREVGTGTVPAGLSRLAIPPAGHVVLEYSGK